MAAGTSPRLCPGAPEPHPGHPFPSVTLTLLSSRAPNPAQLQHTLGQVPWCRRAGSGTVPSSQAGSSPPGSRYRPLQPPPAAPHTQPGAQGTCKAPPGEDRRAAACARWHVPGTGGRGPRGRRTPAGASCTPAAPTPRGQQPQQHLKGSAFICPNSPPPARTQAGPTAYTSLESLGILIKAAAR